MHEFWYDFMHDSETFLATSFVVSIFIVALVMMYMIWRDR
jgi:hypothetical protein